MPARCRRSQATLICGQRRDVVIAPPDGTEARARRARVAVVVFVVALPIGLAWVNTSAEQVLLAADPPRAAGGAAGPPGPPGPNADPAAR